MARMVAEMKEHDLVRCWLYHMVYLTKVHMHKISRLRNECCDRMIMVIDVAGIQYQPVGGMKTLCKQFLMPMKEAFHECTAHALVVNVFWLFKPIFLAFWHFCLDALTKHKFRFLSGPEELLEFIGTGWGS